MKQFLTRHFLQLTRAYNLADKNDLRKLNPIIPEEVFWKIKARLENTYLFNEIEPRLDRDEYLSCLVKTQLPTLPKSAIYIRVSRIAPIYYTYFGKGKELDRCTIGVDERGRGKLVRLDEPVSMHRRKFRHQDLTTAHSIACAIMASLGFIQVMKEDLSSCLKSTGIPTRLRSLTLEYVYFDAHNISEYGPQTKD